MTIICSNIRVILVQLFFTNHLSLAFKLKINLKVLIILNILQLQRYAKGLKPKIIGLDRVLYSIHHLLFAEYKNDITA